MDFVESGSFVSRHWQRLWSMNGGGSDRTYRRQSHANVGLQPEGMTQRCNGHQEQPKSKANEKQGRRCLEDEVKQSRGRDEEK